MNQKGLIKILGIGIVIILAIAASGFIYTKIDEIKNKSLVKENAEESKNQENNQKEFLETEKSNTDDYDVKEIENDEVASIDYVDIVTKKYINVKDLNEEDLKKFFKATEIINNNRHEMSFWTESSCPKNGENYDFIIPEGYNNPWCQAYEEEIGTHGGCPTCVLSKIILNDVDVYYCKHSFCRNSIMYENTELPDAMEISNLENEMSLEIFNSDEKIKEYIGEKTNIEFDQILTKRGIFDKNSNNQTVIVSLCENSCHGIGGEDGNQRTNDYFIITEKEDKIFKFFYFSTQSIIRYGTNFSIEPIELIKGEKPFFMGSVSGCGSGMSVGCSEDYYLFRIIDGELIPSYQIINTWTGTVSKGNDKEGYIDQYIIDNIKKVEVKDINDDRDDEIIITKEEYEYPETVEIKYDKNDNIINKDILEEYKNYQIILDWKLVTIND
jgi:hypothetical protein